MNRLATNLKFLRKTNNISQGDLAHEFDIARTTLGDYERGKTEPSLDMLIRIAKKFDVNIGDLVTLNLSLDDLEVTRNRDLRILAISYDSNDNSNIELVDTKAEAGYLDAFNDPEYIRELPKIQFPNIPQGTYRGFEIRGDSMLPMEPGSIVISSYIENLKDVKEGKTYIVVSKDSGLVYKRIKKVAGENKFILLSDNEAYLPYEIEFSEIAEMWQHYAHISFSDSKTTFNSLVFKLY